ncbi:MAG: preprotein translocase subunit SecE [Candidatus Eremiobacteraeota bacterium]|nr:preprotein translocase subunit SecE [Candidatus Eremiobacteraeota bacterium]
MKKHIDDLVKYLKAVRSEVKRISWPSPQELKASTIVVLVTLAVVTAYLSLVDNLLAAFFKRFIQ